MKITASEKALILKRRESVAQSGQWKRTFEKWEIIAIRDALIEYWHGGLKNAKNDRVKNIVKDLIDEFKRVSHNLK